MIESRKMTSSDDGELRPRYIIIVLLFAETIEGIIVLAIKTKFLITVMMILEKYIFVTSFRKNCEREGIVDVMNAEKILFELMMMKNYSAHDDDDKSKKIIIRIDDFNGHFFNID